MSIRKTSLITSLWFLAYMLLMQSCSGDGYLNAIPGNSTALVSVDIPKLAAQQKGVDANLLKALFHVSDVADCGIDLTAKFYLFETPEGTLGMAAKVKDSGDLERQLESLAAKGECQKVKKHRGKHFTVLNRLWVVGFNDDALLVMGPTVATAQLDLMRQIMKYLDADEGIQGTPLFDRIEIMESPISMVAQAQALPTQLIAPFTVGAPKDTAPSQIMIAAELQAADGCMLMRGESFSFDEGIEKTLKASAAVYRPLQGDYLRAIPNTALFCLLMNVEGQKYLPLMKNSKELRTLLTGMSVKIDIDRFIEGVDGDMVFVVSPRADADFQIEWGATRSADAPQLDEESKAELEKHHLKLSDGVAALPESVLSLLKGKRMGVLVNLKAVDNDQKEVAGMLGAILKPMFGDVSYIVYTAE